MKRYAARVVSRKAASLSRASRTVCNIGRFYCRTNPPATFLSVRGSMVKKRVGQCPKIVVQLCTWSKPQPERFHEPAGTYSCYQQRSVADDAAFGRATIGGRPPAGRRCRRRREGFVRTT